MSYSEGVEIGPVNVLKETASAVLVQNIDTGEEIWIPRSAIEDDDLCDGTTVTVARWFAAQI